MNPFRFRWSIALILATMLPSGASANPPAEQIDFFEKKIRPVLIQHCYKCHSAEAKKIRSGLLLDSRDGIRKGGERGPAIVANQPEKSLLLKALRYEDLQMPPGGKLPESVIADFAAWIKQGAADPRVGVALKEKQIDFEKARKFWAFQPPHRYPTPSVRNREWAKQPIDDFLLARLEQAGLEPSPPADRRTWIRRVSFDLIGLPPSTEEVEAFVNDQAPNAKEKIVERLLSSPHYGERWGRVWLDVVRFAEDQAHIVGNDQSLCYPNAYLYRDWVIRALNADMPYPRFIQLQLAADLFEPGDVKDLPALGFLGLGPKYYSRGMLAVMADEWEDRVDVVGRGLLGLTVACARCHDHKFDPIPTEDYYGLAGIFASTRMLNRPLDEKREKKGDEAKQPKDALHVVCEGKPTDLTVFVRGDVTVKGPTVPRHFLRVLSSQDPQPIKQGSGRLELARAITSENNPLTARVIVNRVWGQLFGQPLVRTPSNFGALGENPSHPELLDDLAVRFMESGWSLKWLQREIVLSAAYGQSSKTDSRHLSADSENRLLGRMNRRRLGVEAWRDAILAATGRLDQPIGGASIDPISPDEHRRTVYSHVSRLSLNPMLALFDFPDPNIHADHRVETTTPLQKLFVINSPFMVRQAQDLTEFLTKKTDGADQSFVQKAYLVLYARPVSYTELRLGLDFLKTRNDAKVRRQEYAQVLLAANEMMFVD
jgi:hypothetical protein